MLIHCIWVYYDVSCVVCQVKMVHIVHISVLFLNFKKVGLSYIRYWEREVWKSSTIIVDLSIYLFKTCQFLIHLIMSWWIDPFYFFVCLFFAILGFELRASQLPGKHSYLSHASFLELTLFKIVQCPSLSVKDCFIAITSFLGLVLHPCFSLFLS
jgi:hypothetical protein